MTVAPGHRFNRRNPCPICGGFDEVPRGKGARCFGFLSDDGVWAHCTRDEVAGCLKMNVESQTYAHRLIGDCGCGVRHDPAPSAPPENTAGQRIIATYDYTDEAGMLLFQVVRFEPKGFAQRQPDGRGGWIWNMKGVRRVLYRLPEVIKAGLVYIPEGERDVETVRRMGMTATCNPMGAGKWRDEYSLFLTGKWVVILVDADEDGRRHALQVARSALPVARDLRMVELSGAKDITAWVELGHTKEDLQELISAAPLMGEARLRELEQRWFPSNASQRGGSPPNAQNQPAPDFKVAAISAAELLRKEFPPGDELVPDLLDKQGALLVSGPQKIGKSHLTTQLCFALAAARQFLIFKHSDRRCRVLYLQAEMSERRMQERIRPLAAIVPPAALDLVKLAWTGSMIKLDEPGGQASVLDLVKEHRPDVLVLDPLMNFMSGDTDKQRDMSRVMGFLDLLRFQFGVAVILVHHHGKKAGERVGGHKALGSVALSAWYESHLILEWHGNPQDRLVDLSFELRHAEAPEPIVLKFDGETRIFQVQSEDTGPVADVLAALRKAGGAGVTARQVSEAARKSESWGRKYLDRAVEQGLVTASDGSPRLYSLPEKAPHAGHTGAPGTHPAGVEPNHNDSNSLDTVRTGAPPYGGGDGVRVVEI